MAGCTMLAAAPKAMFFCSVFGNDPPTGIYDHCYQTLEQTNTTKLVTQHRNLQTESWGDQKFSTSS